MQLYMQIFFIHIARQLKHGGIKVGTQLAHDADCEQIRSWLDTYYAESFSLYDLRGAFCYDITYHDAAF